MPGPKHDELTKLGARWLKRNGFGVVTTEIDAAGSREKPDVIGFRSTCSAIIEVKTSRGDFRADKMKPERCHIPGLGLYRFYLCPAGIIEANEVPDGWGFLSEENGRIAAIKRPQGNLWPGAGTEIAEWRAFQHDVNAVAERHVLYSIARRLSAKQ